MSDVGLPRRRYAIEGTIVLLFFIAAIIGFIVRAKDAPSAAPEAVSIPTAIAKVMSLDGLSLRSEQPLFSLDLVTVSRKPLPVTSVKEIAVRPTDAIGVSGWAADRIAGLPANGIFVAVGAGKPVALQYGGARPDVAKALGNPNLDKTGFTGELPRGLLPSGSLPLRFFVVDSSGSSYDEVPSPISLTVK